MAVHTRTRLRSAGVSGSVLITGRCGALSEARYSPDDRFCELPC